MRWYIVHAYFNLYKRTRAIKLEKNKIIATKILKTKRNCMFFSVLCLLHLLFFPFQNMAECFGIVLCFKSFKQYGFVSSIHNFSCKILKNAIRSLDIFCSGAIYFLGSSVFLVTSWKKDHTLVWQLHLLTLSWGNFVKGFMALAFKLGFKHFM